MTQSTDPSQPKTVQIRNSLSVEQIVNRVMFTIDRVDEGKASSHVASLVGNYPDTSPDELAELLIREKCLQAGTIGAATSSAAIIPGVGPIMAITGGTVVDLGMTLKIQAELILEIAKIYNYTFAPTEKQRTLLLVMGLSVGTEQLLIRAGTRISEKLTEQFAERAVIKAIPFLGVAASAAIDIISTYTIGKRAQAYFKLGPDAIDDWVVSMRTITGIDERRISAWLSKKSGQSWGVVKNHSQTVGKAAVRQAGLVGQKLGTNTKQKATQTLATLKQLKK